MRTIAALAVGAAALGGCSSYTYNCNVKDACRTAAADAPGVHIVTGVGAPAAPATPPR